MSQNAYFTFETGLGTDVGCLRLVNEDNLLARPDFGLWAVSDGMGGHAAGDFASTAIVQELSSVGISTSGEDLHARFMERLTRANATIISHAADLNSGTIGATVVSLLVHDDRFTCVWSGDSRVYLLRNRTLIQQSRDHTEVRALLDAGSITEEQALHWPRKNVITRAIGVTDVPQCDVVQGQVNAGDVFLLCSDGLTEHLADTEIAETLMQLPPQAACDALIAETLKRGARDNVTVMIIHCIPTSPHSDDDRLRHDGIMGTS